MNEDKIEYDKSVEQEKNIDIGTSDKKNSIYLRMIIIFAVVIFIGVIVIVAALFLGEKDVILNTLGIQNKNSVDVEETDVIDDEVVEEVVDKVSDEAVDEDSTEEIIEDVMTFDPFEGFEIKYKGINGEGTASISKAPYDGIEYVIDKNTDLSNGDEIEVTVIYSEEECKAENHGGLPSTVSRNYTVKNLNDPEPFDPFEGFELAFSGNDGVGTAEILRSHYEGIEYVISKTSELSNDDKIEVTVEYSEEECKKRNHGSLPNVISKEFTVSTLKEAESFNPFDGIEIIFSGIDGKGVAELISSPYKAVEYVISKDKELINGEEITVSVKYSDEECKKENDGSLPNLTERIYKVTGLEEPEPFDPFDKLKVVFSGVNGKGIARITAGEYKGVTYKINKASNLSNGDEIKITITYREDECREDNDRRLPNVKEKSYTVKSLTEKKEPVIAYVKKLKDVPQKVLDAMNIKVKKALQSKIEDEGRDLTEATLIGYYLLSSTGDIRPKNYLYLIYDVEEEDEKAGLRNYYWYGCYEDIKKTGNAGEMVNLDSFKIPDRSESFKFSKNDRIKYSGYKEIDEMYDNLVLTKLDYDVESTVKELERNNEANDNTDESNIEKESSKYILPKSDKRYVSEDELNMLSAEECRLARNEIYARHGRRFLDETVQAYFNNQDWYEGTIDAGNFSESVLNEYERKNADMILAYENKKGYR